MTTTPEQLRDDAVNVLENIEDTVEHICDTHFLSGEKVWVMISALSDYKLAEFSSSPDIDFEEELPRHPTGKLYKRLLKDKYWK